MPQSAAQKSRPSKNANDTAQPEVAAVERDSAAEQPSTGKLQYEASLSTPEAIAYFESVIEGLKKGAVHFRHGGQTLTVTPTKAVTVEISAARKSQKQKIRFELCWDSGKQSKLEID